MKRFNKIIYYLKLFLFIIHFYFVFIVLHNILDIKIYGYLFLIIYFFYIIKVITELLSKKERYKNDLIYNLMQIGFLGYIIGISIKLYISKLYVTDKTITYFRTNYLIASLLIVFIIIYGILCFYNKKK